MRSPPQQAPLLWQIYLAFWISGITAVAWPFPALVCALLLPFADKRLRRAVRLGLATSLWLLGLAVAHWQLYSPAPVRSLSDSRLTERRDKPPPHVCGVVNDVQGLSDNRLRVFLQNTHMLRSSQTPATERSAENREALPAPDLTAWTWEAPFFNPLPGQTVCLDRQPREIHGFANEGLADFDVWWKARGVSFQVWSRADQGNPQLSGEASAPAVWRANLIQAFLTALVPKDPEPLQNADGTSHSVAAYDMPQGKAILVALLFGDRRFIRQQTMNNFSAATLAHSLALSGQHLSVAGLLGLVCVLAAARLYAPLYLKQPRFVCAVLAACLPALVYLWIGNAPASLVRASCMLFVSAVWITRHHPRTMLDALCAALLCITVVSPLSALDVGLQLSVLCVGVIGLGLPLLRRVLPSDAETGRAQSFSKRCVRRLLQILLVSMLIQTALLPMNLLIFGNAGFWFPLNMLWLPAVDLLVLPGAFFGLALQMLGMETAARFTLNLMAAPGQWLADALVWFNGHNLLQGPALLRPHWPALPAFAALSGALALTAGRSCLPDAGRRLLYIGLVLLCVGPIARLQSRFSQDMRLRVVDVGQGQALVLRFPGHLRLLLDGGGSASPRFEPGKSLVAPVLTNNDAPYLTAVINSHPDIDHMGGLIHILQQFSVDALFDNGQSPAGLAGQQWGKLRRELGSRPLAEGDELIVGDPDSGLRLAVLHPPRKPLCVETPTDGVQSTNDESLVLRLLRRGEGLVLLPGDAGNRVLRRLLASGHDLRANVLIAPHHGSDTGFLPDFYKAVQPRLVLASCGFQNSYGHPGRKLQAWLAQQGIPLLTTAQYGQISVTLPERGPARVSSARAKTD